MDNLQLIALQNQRVLQRRLDMTANNLANVSTNGFKADALVTELDARRPARSVARPTDIRFVSDFGSARDLDEGALRRTGEALDLAIDGEGYFTVQGPDGPAYTRDGAFRLDGNGGLVTKDGRAVLNAGGAPIVFAAQGQPPEIDSEGAIRIGGAEVGRIAVVSFARPEALDKIGDNLFDAKGQPTAPALGRVAQGMLEGSNVEPVLELTRLIEISRAYEMAQKIINDGDELRQKTIAAGRAA